MFNKNCIYFISGPCSFESELQISKQLEHQKNQQYLRAGIYKLRTQKDSFQGLRSRAIAPILKLKAKYGLKIISEVVSIDSAKELSEVVDVFQVGTRNMYNYELLNHLNEYEQPVLLKRAFSATIKEWIEAAKYIEDSEQKVILCERGIRTFENAYRNTLDLNAVAYIKEYTNYQIFVDPSHGTGNPALVKKMALASVAAGADGIIVESHFDPSKALSDKDQALNLDQLQEIKQEVANLTKYLKKDFVS
jgi:3-deoxy-7-phosphoheptulonate synthase